MPARIWSKSVIFFCFCVESKISPNDYRKSKLQSNFFYVIFLALATLRKLPHMEPLDQRWVLPMSSQMAYKWHGKQKLCIQNICAFICYPNDSSVDENQKSYCRSQYPIKYLHTWSPVKKIIMSSNMISQVEKIFYDNVSCVNREWFERAIYFPVSAFINYVIH